MAKEQYLDLAGLTTYDEEIKSHIETVADEKADIQHNHTVSEITDLLDLTEEEIAELCEFDGNPDNIIPIASKASMGCVVAGDGLDIDDNGVLSVQSLTDEEIESICEFDEGMTEDNVIPKATKTALGCIKVGDGLAIDSTGRLSATGGGSGVATAGIGSAGMKLLWENENPTASFAAQTIELDLSEYDIVKVVYMGWAQYEYSIFEEEILVNSKGRLAAPMDYNWNRDVATTDSTIIFATAKAYGTYGNTSTVDNNLACIPIAIYGDTIAPPNVDYTLTEEKETQELLWTNPDPTATFAAQTINLDLSEYDSVRVLSRTNTTSNHRRYFDCPVGNSQQIFSFGSAGAGAATHLSNRSYTTSISGISFENSYYKNLTNTTVETDNFSCIPVEIYGIKNKINVTTAVVTDKGQHTDLLWENASPTSEFVAQTVELDLSGYDMFEVRARYSTTSAREFGMTVEKNIDSNVFVVHYDNLAGYRMIKFTDSGIEFGKTVFSMTDNQNTYCIPTRIYGIKHNAATTSTIMGDYVVEEGTSGIWTYRKWNSGIAECWGTTSISSAMDTSWGNAYISSATASISYPFTFTERPIENVSLQTSSSAAWLMHESNAPNTTTQTGLYRAARSNSDSAVNTIYFDIQVKGRWK